MIPGEPMTMTTPDTDKLFAGSIPKLYDTYLVPLLFEPYAADLVHRLKPRSLSRVQCQGFEAVGFGAHGTSFLVYGGLSVV